MTPAFLADVAHRPWPLPDGPWVMHQSWLDFLLMHWPLPPEAVRAVVPAALPLDLWDGRAWLGIVPFHMAGVRLRGTVDLPGIAAFPELNVRTYVKVGDHAGVYFLSLEATARVPIEVARLTYGLPYFKADMHWERDGERIRYHSRRTDRRGPPAELEGSYAPRGPTFHAEPGTLEHWLAERYALFTVDGRGRPRVGHVHHRPWPLRAADVDFPTNTMAAAHGLTLPDAAPHVLYSPGVDTVVWPMQTA